MKLLRLFMVIAALVGCVGKRPLPPSPQDARLETKTPDQNLEEMSPRARASLRLTERARQLIEEGQENDAITTLEQAINLNSANSLSYYYMAEAWLRKGDTDRALKFNILAKSGLSASREWSARVEAQRERIELSK